MNDFSLVIHGKPRPAGSKRAFKNPNTGAVMIADANKHGGPVEAGGLATRRLRKLTAEADLGGKPPELPLFPRGVPVILSVIFNLETAEGPLRHRAQCGHRESLDAGCEADGQA